MVFQNQDEKTLENIMLKKQDVGTFNMSKSYITIFNARDKAIDRGVELQYKLSDGVNSEYFH